MKEKLVKFVKQWIGNSEWKSGAPDYTPNELLVLCYHATPEAYMPAFENQFDWYCAQGFTVLSASQFPQFLQGKHTSGPYVMFTFDDGLRNNIHVARFLREKGVDAYFFLVPAFLECKEAAQPAYYQRVMRPVINDRWEPLNERVAFRPEEVKQLLTMGHSIGAHTYSHGLTSEEQDEEVLKKETAGVKKYLRSAFDLQTDAFCSINQTDMSVSRKTMELIEEYYAYHFTTFPGTNTPQTNPMCIYRRNVEVFWSMGEVRYAVGKKMLRRWEERVREARAALQL